MHPISCTNTHHDVTNLVNHGMVKNTKTWISWEQNISFPGHKKILNLYLRWHIFRSYRFFVAEVPLESQKQCLQGFYSKRCSLKSLKIYRKASLLGSQAGGQHLHQIETLVLVLYCEFCKIFKETNFINVNERLLLKSKIFVKSLFS